MSMRRKVFISIPRKLWNFDLPEQSPPSILQAGLVTNRQRKEDLIAHEKDICTFKSKLHKKVQAHSKVPVEDFT